MKTEIVKEIKTKNKCLTCGEQVSGAQKYCSKCKIIRHREANKRHYNKMVSEGCCVFCGKETMYRVVCDSCCNKMIEYSRRRK